MPVVAAVPWFDTSMFHVPFVPAAKLPLCDFAIARFGALTVVASDARSFEASMSPGVLTLAKFVTLGPAATATAAVSVNGALAPAAIEAGRTALTTWPLALKLPPDPALATYVIAAGS